MQHALQSNWRLLTGPSASQCKWEGCNTEKSRIPELKKNKNNLIVTEISWFGKSCRGRLVYLDLLDWGDTLDLMAHQDWPAYKDYQEAQDDR